MNTSAKTHLCITVFFIIITLLSNTCLSAMSAEKTTYLKHNGLRVWQSDNKYFFVGANDEVRTGFNTNQPKALLDFNGTSALTNTTAEIINNYPDHLMIKNNTKKVYLTDDFVYLSSLSNADAAKDTLLLKTLMQEKTKRAPLGDDMEFYKKDYSGSMFYLDDPIFQEWHQTLQNDKLSEYFTTNTISTTIGQQRSFVIAQQGYRGAKLFAHPVRPQGRSAMIQLSHEVLDSKVYLALHVNGSPIYLKTATLLDPGPLTLDGADIDNPTEDAGYHGGGPNKTFVIDHPIDSQRFLVHSALEGPNASVFYYGTAQLVNGRSTIALPDYFESLTEPTHRQILLSAINSPAELFVASSSGIKNGQFTVASDTHSDALFNWRVVAIRKDVGFQVEPKKSDIKMLRKGPYTYAK